MPKRQLSILFSGWRPLVTLIFAAGSPCYGNTEDCRDTFFRQTMLNSIAAEVRLALLPRPKRRRVLR